MALCELYRFKALGITSARKPVHTHLFIEISNGNIYIVDSVDSTKIYKSTDKGENWKYVPLSAQINNLTFSPSYSQDNTVFISMFGGIVKSIDGGNNWTVKNNGFIKDNPGHDVDDDPLQMSATTISPSYSSDKTIFVVDGSNSAIYRSTNGGNNWNLLTKDLPGNIGSIVISPTYTTDKVVFVGGSYLYKSTNSGSTWTNMNFTQGIYGIVIAGETF
ncbi:hypothetical protein LCGC14_3161400 [marine sediment metagenome]|uniref:DUF6242 domain-containing protein n=1 Tax=marine sediment metagenome TaxID=412755 RepID=A0A0F8VR13_9ZZZZ